MNWQNKKIHCVGIKGSGISGLAILLKNEGAIISGSDTAEEFPSEKELAKNNIEIKLFSAENISKEIDLVIYSSAWTEEHEERAKAKELGIEELSYAEALVKYAEGKEVIVVTGTHGKTTTTALLGQIFESGERDPNVLTGDAVKAWDSSVRAGKGKYFIIEGDEYQEKFAMFSPAGAIIPSLDYDHTDYFKTPEDYKNSFKHWIEKNPGMKFITTKEVQNSLGVPATLSDESDEKIFAKANFIFPGEHYRQNALLAIKLSRLFGIPEEKIIEGINSFKGVGRRLDFYTPERGDFVVVYDYAHHPVEIKATLKALKEKYGGYKIVAIFQPHTFTRTKAFLNEFAQAFGDADEVYFEEIYSSAREKKPDISIEDLIRETGRYKKAQHLSDFDLKNFAPPTLFVFMGAGDIWQKAKKIAGLLGA